MNSYAEAVAFLESLQIMPKTMPGLQKIRKALALTDWFSKIDPGKIVVVAGTNGKGSTCAALEALLTDAGQRVGFYSSPHLVSTTERIRENKKAISENIFLQIFRECAAVIKECQLSHFEALTFMAAHFFFNRKTEDILDFVIFEVGLGGTFDATNAIPHKYNIITALGIDHAAILGNTLQEVAANKFGIVGNKGIVVHQPLQHELLQLKAAVTKKTNSNWIEAEQGRLRVETTGSEPGYFVTYVESEFQLALPGRRAMENAMNAVTMFQILGFDFSQHAKALMKIDWQGRMQKVPWPGLRCPLYLSGDHNEQGILSLIEILKDFRWRELHIIAGIGTDKAAASMLDDLLKIPSVNLYLTETPFKGLKITEYPAKFRAAAKASHPDVLALLSQLTQVADVQDLCVVTGSLYLVGRILASVPIK